MVGIYHDHLPFPWSFLDSTSLAWESEARQIQFSRFPVPNPAVMNIWQTKKEKSAKNAKLFTHLANWKRNSMKTKSAANFKEPRQVGEKLGRADA